MGTRSWTRFYKRSPRSRKLVGVVYRQWDGYPEGVGKDVVEFLRKCTAATAEEALEAYLQLLRDTATRHFLVPDADADPQCPTNAIHIEWTYDIEYVERENNQRAVGISVIPGCGRVDPPHTSEWVVACGSADAVEEWIDAGPYNVDSSTRSITG